MKRCGVFITGTDTGVGKTHVAMRLAQELRARGRRVATFKPIETGVGAEHVSDAQRLGATCVYSLRLAAAPAEAAEAENISIDCGRILAAFHSLADDVVVVEGVGGLLVPIDQKLTMADLAEQLGLPVLLIAKTRLGTINHTLLSVREIERRNLVFLGTLLNTHQGDALSHEPFINFFGGKVLGRYPENVDWESLISSITSTR